jgi:hypothetical protein
MQEVKKNTKLFLALFNELLSCLLEIYENFISFFAQTLSSFRFESIIANAILNISIRFWVHVKAPPNEKKGELD